MQQTLEDLTYHLQRSVQLSFVHYSLWKHPRKDEILMIAEDEFRGTLYENGIDTKDVAAVIDCGIARTAFSDGIHAAERELARLVPDDRPFTGIRWNVAL